MAGDIREIDMTKATSLDGKKVRLVGDDGKGYWMEKDTFISVVGELIGISSNIKNIVKYYNNNGNDILYKVFNFTTSYMPKSVHLLVYDTSGTIYLDANIVATKAQEIKIGFSKIIYNSGFVKFYKDSGNFYIRLAKGDLYMKAIASPDLFVIDDSSVELLTEIILS